MKISVIVPVFNEEATLNTINDRILATGIPNEIIYVNDGSTDRSGAILSKFSSNPLIKLVNLPANKGKGFAIRKGIDVASGEIIILQDADLEYAPEEYQKLITPFDQQQVQIVYGARFTENRRRSFYLPHYLANRLLTFLTNVLFHSNLNDMETGYKVFKRELFPQLNITANGFEFEPEFTAKALQMGLKIHQIPISFNPRNYQQGKKIKFKDAILAVITLVRIRFSKKPS